MATLGQLTAGMAHELNNPVAAIRRAADFIAEDMVSLVTTLPNGETIRATLPY
ncbi:MAG: histidine kinase dimerization/phospho-acceptor domain-containing protein [Phycisphaerae bacterium]